MHAIVHVVEEGISQKVRVGIVRARDCLVLTQHLSYIVSERSVEATLSIKCVFLASCS